MTALLRGVTGLALVGAIPALAVGQSLPAPTDGATLTIDITGLRNARGVIHVDVCRQGEFLKKCAVVNEVKATAGTTVVRIATLPPGTYAVQATHDENSNGKVDRGLFGIPREGVGFSNDAPIRLGPPKWADAQFVLTTDKTISLKMRYFLGGGARN